MDLLRKVRTLVGALLHQPFTPRPEKVDSSERPDRPQAPAERRDGTSLERQATQTEDTERVADLIQQQTTKTE